MIEIEFNNYPSIWIESAVEEFVWDGCHKIYLLESPIDKRDALENGYTLEDFYPIKKLGTIYRKSCSLKFIRYWDIKKDPVVAQSDARPSRFIIN